MEIIKEELAVFKHNIANILSDGKFKEYMTRLDNGKLSFPFSEVLRKCQRGYCEDFAFYFYAKYPKIVEIFCINQAHFVIQADGMFFDSFSLTGVNSIRQIPFFKGSKEITIYNWEEKELPDYYRKTVNDVLKI